jgi:hypothetical protein
MKVAVLGRLKRLETVQGSRLQKFEFAYLKQLPREYSGPRHIVKVGQRPDGRCEYEERLGPPPPDHVEESEFFVFDARTPT